MKICVIIPTHNESKTIADIIKQIRNQSLEVVVIDDGSSDKTAQIAQENGATVIKNKTNEGKGASLIKGFQYALNENFDAAITMDGDGQHLPSEIPYFISLAKDPNTTIVIGNRMNEVKNMPYIRIITNKFMSWLISNITKQKIPDTQCGFRLIKKELLIKLKLATLKFETESEVLTQASRLGFKIESINIKTIYAQENSQINPFIDTLRFIRFVAKEISKRSD